MCEYVFFELYASNKRRLNKIDSRYDDYFNNFQEHQRCYGPT